MSLIGCETEMEIVTASFCVGVRNTNDPVGVKLGKKRRKVIGAFKQNLGNNIVRKSRQSF